MTSLPRPEGFQADRHSCLPCCGVLAVATLACAPFGKAWEVLAAMKKRSGAWKGRTTNRERVAALRKLGVRPIVYAIPSRRPTLGAWVRERSKPGVSYMVNVTGHVVSVRDGIVQDQFEVLPVAQYHSRRKVVNNVTIVEVRS